MDPSVVQFQEGFTWPLFVITADVLRELDLLPTPTDGASLQRIMLYNQLQGVWAKIKTDHVVGLKAGDRVFLKFHSVRKCNGFDRLLEGISKTLHQRHDLPEVRKQVRQQIAEKTKRKVSYLSSKAKGKAKATSVIELTSSEEDGDLARPAQSLLSTSGGPARPARSLSSTSSSSADSSSSTDSPAPVPSISRKRKPAPPRSFSVTSSGSSDLPVSVLPVKVKIEPGLERATTPTPTSLDNANYMGKPIEISSDDDDSSEDDDDTKVWPASFFVIDVVTGFQKLEAAKAMRLPMSDTFEAFFGVPWSSSTYYDHLARWKAAPQSARDEAVAAQRSRPKGLWSTFMASTNLTISFLTTTVRWRSL